ncbi:MAG TPA: hypothetical protein VJ279_08415 [Hanamia sp.]|jgi:hypothetical protein|nr:hypothetical protein [Hanamia sp.]
MVTPADSTFGTFFDGGDLEINDIVVGLRNGINTRFNFQGSTGLFLPLLGGTMQGAIDMDTNIITGLPVPTNATDAVNKSYADSLVTGDALTKVDDTNVTLSLGGTPATALLRAVSLTLGWTGTLSGTRGGTGVNNGANTATYAGNLNFAGDFTTAGAFAVTQTYTAPTNVTFPTSGTLATTSQLPTGAALTKTDDTNVTLTLGGSPLTALLNAASLTLGWTGNLSVARGGSGAGSFTAYAVLCGGTTSTSPFQSIASVGSSGQVLTSNGAGALPTFQNVAGTGTVNSGLINQLAWYDAAGTAVSGLTIVNSAALTTTAGGVPTWVAYTGSGAPVLANTPTLITPVLGAATATSINFGGSTLSNYTEGTWVPTITGSTTNPTSVGYSTQLGNYTRIGNVVYYHVTLIVNSLTIGAAAGDLQITGLPFTSKNTTGLTPLGSCTSAGLSGGTGYTFLNSWIDPNATVIKLINSVLGAASGDAFHAITGLTNSSIIRVSGHYYV